MGGKISLLQTGIFIGVCIGAIAGFLFPINLLQYWKRLTYFPYPVEKIINVWGDKIWVETEEGNSFVLIYPCDEKLCWRETKLPTNLFNRSGFGPSYDLQITDTCKFEHLTYPLFRRTKMCVGTNYPVADTISWIYLALTENGEIWAWQGGFIIPPACFFFPFAFAIIGIFPGLAIGSVLIGMEKLKTYYRKQKDVLIKK
jgi:hypothetical protein